MGRSSHSFHFCIFSVRMDYSKTQSIRIEKMRKGEQGTIAKRAKTTGHQEGKGMGTSRGEKSYKELQIKDILQYHSTNDPPEAVKPWIWGGWTGDSSRNSQGGRGSRISPTGIESVYRNNQPPIAQHLSDLVVRKMTYSCQKQIAFERKGSIVSDAK